VSQKHRTTVNQSRFEVVSDLLDRANSSRGRETGQSGRSNLPIAFSEQNTNLGL
jgi:hypothetical protein